MRTPKSFRSGPQPGHAPGNANRFPLVCQANVVTRWILVAAIFAGLSSEIRLFGQGAGVGAAARQSYPLGNEDRGEDDMSMDEMMEEEMMMEDEMMDEDLYGESYGGSSYGGSGRRSRGGDTNTVLQQLSASQSSALLSRLDLNAFINPPGVVAPADAGPVLRSDAELAVKNGHYPLAMELYFAHMAVDYEKARGDIQTAQYSRLMRRPTWAIRWGVSMAVRGEALDPNPIRDTGSGRLASTGRGGSGGEFGSMDEGMEDGMGMEDERMEMEMEMGDGMEDMEDEMMGRGPGSQGPGGLMGRGRGGREAPAPAIQREMLSSEAQELFSKNLGLVAEKLAQEFDKRYRAGDFGNALITVGAPVEGVSTSSEFMSEGFTQAIDTSPEPIPMWKPGLLFLGEGDSKDMASVARKANLDLYFHFDVLLKELRGEWVQNISRIRIIHAPTGKTLGTSKSFDSYEVATQVRAGRGSEDSYVQERMDTLFGIVDRQVKTSPLPGLTTDIARRRVGQLLSGPGARSLRTLAEVRLYQAQELLTEEEVEAAFDIVGGEEGLMMLHGSHEERVKLARTWAVNALKARKR